MFDGQILFKGCTVYSPWMQRGGDSIRATLEVAAISGATIQVNVFTKKHEDSGDGTDANAAIKILTSATGRSVTEWLSDLNDLVRFKFTVTGTNPYDWVLFRMLAPVWFDTLA